MKKIVLILFLLASFVSSPTWGGELVQKCTQLLKTSFPNTNWGEIRRSPIPGICEASTGSNVLYVFPGDPPLLIFGALYTFDGKDLTAIRRAQLRKQILDEIFQGKVDAKPLLIGEKGVPQYVEFVDPFCVHCRRAERELRGVPRLLFFYPLSKRSEAVAAAVLCASDPRTEWEKVIAGEYDRKIVTAPEKCIALVEKHKKLGRYLGVRGTPTIFDRQGRSPSPTLIASKIKQNKRR